MDGGPVPSVASREQEPQEGVQHVVDEEFKRAKLSRKLAARIAREGSAVPQTLR